MDRLERNFFSNENSVLSFANLKKIPLIEFMKKLTEEDVQKIAKQGVDIFDDLLDAIIEEQNFEKYPYVYTLDPNSDGWKTWSQKIKILDFQVEDLEQKSQGGGRRLSKHKSRRKSPYGRRTLKQSKRSRKTCRK
jgi:hypothetical protein